MLTVSTAIMAHPERARFIPDLLKQMPGETEVVWDRENDRWDTGRRALLSYDPDADWHLVVQDDAILCRDFMAGVVYALTPLQELTEGIPVSFYTGKTRPYGEAIRRAVIEAQRMERNWLALRGPLWGVAVALPTPVIDEMVETCDEYEIPNYDMRMAEWFHDRGKPCFYSVPSLVDHRVGEANPSLVPDRGASPARTAHMFLGDEDPTAIDWWSEAHFVGDPSEPWTEDFSCTRCGAKHPRLADAVTHAAHAHGIGPFDFLASTPYHARELIKLRNELPEQMVGKFYIISKAQPAHVSVPFTRLRSGNARNKLAKDRAHFTICGAARDLKYIGARPGWSVVGGEAN